MFRQVYAERDLRGTLLPWWRGVSHTDLRSLTVTTYPIPFHKIVGGSLRFLRWLQRGHRVRREEEIFACGRREGLGVALGDTFDEAHARGGRAMLDAFQATRSLTDDGVREWFDGRRADDRALVLSRRT